MSMGLSILYLVLGIIGFFAIFFIILFLLQKKRYINEEVKITARKIDETGKKKVAVVFKVTNVEFNNNCQNRLSTKSFIVISLNAKNVSNIPASLYDYKMEYKVGRKVYEPMIEGASNVAPDLSIDFKLLIEAPKEANNGKLFIHGDFTPIFYLTKRPIKK